MDKLGEKVEIGSGFTADDGTPLEPEEQPVKRTIFTEANVNIGSGPQGDSAVGKLPVSILSEMPAYEAVDLLTSECRNCIHWQSAEWPRIRAALSFEELGALRASILSRGPDEIPQLDDGNDDVSVDHALADGTHGVCKILSDMARDSVVTFFSATCPDTAPDGSPLPLQFKARGDVRRAVTRARDVILISASGKKE